MSNSTRGGGGGQEGEGRARVPQAVILTAALTQLGRLHQRKVVVKTKKSGELEQCNELAIQHETTTLKYLELFQGH